MWLSLFLKQVSYEAFFGGWVGAVLTLHSWLACFNSVSGDEMSELSSAAEPISVGFLHPKKNFNLKKNKKTRIRCCDAGYVTGVRILAPGYWSASAWAQSWVREVGRAKKESTGPVPLSTFNERRDHAGVKVQVEQFSARTHGSCSSVSMKE